jgi:soluble lytic murein transglycosylase-like protein
LPERPRRLALFAALLGLLVAGSAGAQEPVDQALRARLAEAASEAASFTDRFDAEVWLTDMSTRLTRQVPDDEERLTILKLAHAEATRAQLAPELVLAVIDVESNFDRFALSHAGARGLMQVMPFWLNELGRPDDNLFRIDTNLRYGCTILKYYLDRENGDLIKGLARYNGSVGKRWYGDRVVDKLRLKWFQQ